MKVFLVTKCPHQNDIATHFSALFAKNDIKLIFAALLRYFQDLEQPELRNKLIQFQLYFLHF